MTPSPKSKNNVVPRHDWLLPEVDEVGFVTFFFPCHNLWGGDSRMVFETRDLLTMVADDRDKSGADGTLLRQIRDRHFPEDLDCRDMQDLQGLDEFLTEIEAIEPPPIPVEADDFSDEDEPTPYVPDMCARPPRQTRIMIPATKRSVATALEFETRYLLSLIAMNSSGSPRQRWWKTLTEIFYPEIEPPEFQRLPTDEAFRKEHYTSFLRYLAVQAQMKKPTHPDAKNSIEREFAATRTLLIGIGLFGNIEPYRPGEDDVTETCGRLCSLIDQLPAGVLNIEH